MSTAVLDAPAPVPETPDVPRKHWTRAEYRHLIEIGVLQDGKVELVSGEIWEKVGQGRKHIEEPTPADMLLVVEASNTTLRADLRDKQIMYARSGIPEYWVVDIPNRLLHVFRDPGEGGYAKKTVLTADAEVRPLAAPDSVVRVADLLP